MKSSECNFCFVCLSNLEKVGRIQFKKGRQRRDDVLNKRKRANSIKFLITYLLTNQDQSQAHSKNYDNVITEILYLNGMCVGDNYQKVDRYLARNYFRLCDKCEGIAGRIMELHLELEKVQMKIIQEVKTVREAVLRSSGWLRGIGLESDVGDGGKEKEAAFENFSRRYFEGDQGSMEETEVRQTFEVLKAFQTAVSETDKSSILVPLVHLQKYSVPQKLPPSGSVPEDPAMITKTDPLTTGQDDKDIDMEKVMNDYGFPEVDVKYNPSDNLALSDPMGFEEGPDFFQAGIITGSSSAPSSALDVKVKIEARAGTESSPSQSISAAAPTSSRAKKRRRRSTIGKRRKLRRPIGALHTKRKYYKRRDEGSDIPLLRRLSEQYHCDSCPFTCKFLSRFEQHLRDHEVEEKSYQCDQCPQGFSTQQHFFFHQGLHKGYYKARCYVCLEFMSKIDLLVHMKTHSDDAFPCSYCSLCFISMEVYMEHVRKSHVGVKDMKCEICGMSLPSKISLAKHLHEVHQAVQKLQCDVEGCSEAFLNPQSLYAHKCLHERRFTCKVCCVPFRSKNGLESHQKTHAGIDREKSYKCDQCPEAFISSESLRVHSFREHEAAGFKCEDCDREFPLNWDLRNHRILEHGEEGGFHCPVCNKKFPSPGRLRRHVSSHATEKNFICDECGKSFGSLMKCNVHKRIHGEKKHQCNYCPKAFTKRIYLVEHIRTHTGEKPYPCDICGKAFSQRGPLNIHKKRCSVLRGTVKNEEPQAGANPTDLLGFGIVLLPKSK